jgi:hypothetical protein
MFIHYDKLLIIYIITLISFEECGYERDACTLFMQTFSAESYYFFFMVTYTFICEVKCQEMSEQVSCTGKDAQRG